MNTDPNKSRQQQFNEDWGFDQGDPGDEQDEQTPRSNDKYDRGYGDMDEFGDDEIDYGQQQKDDYDDLGDEDDLPF